MFDLWPFFLGYCEEQGAVGGAGLEEDINDLRLEEENEQPPLILETDWSGGEPDPSLRGRVWCCYSKCDTVVGGGGGGGWIQDQEARGVFKRCSGAHLCAHLLAYVCHFSSLSFASAGQTDALHVHVPTAETRSHVSESVCWMFDLKKTKQTNVAMSLKAHTGTQALCKKIVIV